MQKLRTNFKICLPKIKIAIHSCPKQLFVLDSILRLGELEKLSQAIRIVKNPYSMGLEPLCLTLISALRALRILDSILRSEENLISRDRRRLNEIRGFSCPKCHFHIVLDSSDKLSYLNNRNMSISDSRGQYTYFLT